LEKIKILPEGSSEKKEENTIKIVTDERVTFISLCYLKKI
jgi:hypothetical protein